MAKPWALFMQGSKSHMPTTTEELRGLFTDIPSWMSMLRMVASKAGVAVMTMHGENGSQSRCKVIGAELVTASSSFDNPFGR